MHPSIANELMQSLQHLKETDPNNPLTKLIIKSSSYNQNKLFLIAEGNKEDRHLLPKPFICQGKMQPEGDPAGLNSATRQLRWRFPVLSKIVYTDNTENTTIFKREKASIEDILNEPGAVIDIETEKWKKGQDSIFMLVYASPTRQIIMHDLPFDITKQENFELIKYKSQQELGELLTKIIKEEDPLWIYGHNIMGFDQIKLREITKAYHPATNETHPITKASMGLGKVISRGRFTLDTYRYMFNYRNIFSTNKLESLVDLDKSINYEEQAQLVIQAKKGDQEAFRKLVHYCIEDGIYSRKAAELFKKLVVAKALYFQTSPDTICSSSKLNVARESWKQRHYQKKGTYVDAWKTYSAREKNLSLDELKNEYLLQDFQRGRYNDVHVLYLTPFIGGLNKFVKNHFGELYQLLKEAKEPLEKFDIMQTLNAELSYLVEETQKIIRRERIDLENIIKDKLFSLNKQHPLTKQQKAAFHCLFNYHGLKNVDELDFLSGLSKGINATNTALSQYQIINRGKLLYFVKGDIDYQKLEEKLYGCHLGIGKVLSIDKGRIIADPFNKQELKGFVSQGFSLKGRKTNFEKRVTEEVITRILNGKLLPKIKDYLDKESREFIAGEKKKEEYYVAVSRRTYFKNLLEDIIEARVYDSQSEIKKETLQSYQNIKRNIGKYYTRETRKKLAKVLSECFNDHAYPMLVEVIEQIESPFPPRINLIYGQEGILIPAHLGLPDLREYQEKLTEKLKPLYLAAFSVVPDFNLSTPKSDSKFNKTPKQLNLTIPRN